MKTVANIILILLFIPLFLIGVLATTVRFQILDSNFWLSSFSQNNVYADLASVIKKSAEDKTVAGGGNKGDARVLTNLITPENIQDIVSKNLVNILGFMNGSTKELIVYFPIDKVPKGLLPTNIGLVSDSVPITTLASTLNVQGFGTQQLKIISSIGFWSTVLVIVDFALLLVISVLLYILIVPGRRFLNLAIAFVLSGIVVLVFFALGQLIRSSMINQWSLSKELIQRVLSTFSPFVTQKILNFWLAIGVGSLVLGIVLFFLKKRVYNNRK